MALTAAGAGCWAPWRAGSGRSVVLIVVDTLRADHLGVYGYPRPTSPALDAWAKQSVVFEHAYATAPWTLPSFGSIYTGERPARHMAGAVVIADGAEPTREFAALDPGVPALAEILRDSGYETAAIVGNPFLHPRFGLARGFRNYDYVPGGDNVIRRADVMVNHALAWLDTHAQQPFFLLLHLMDPHMDYDPPAATRGWFSSAYPSAFSLPVRNEHDIRRRAASIPAGDRAFITAAYDEEVAFTALEIGRFLQALQQRGLLARTLVLLIADHGEELFDHDSFAHGHTVYEELLHVPLIVWGPAVRPGRIATAVSLADVAPTILDVLGIHAPGMAGISLWNAVSTGAALPERFLFAEHTGTGPERKAVIYWPYKLIIGDDGSPPRLLDLAIDPREANDGDQVPAVVSAALQEQAEKALRTETPATQPSGVKMDAATRERLRALGYLE